MTVSVRTRLTGAAAAEEDDASSPLRAKRICWSNASASNFSHGVAVQVEFENKTFETTRISYEYSRFKG